MAIWSAEIKELERLHESFKGQLPDLEKELERLVKADDENMILLYSRRCLEVIITDLCECELKRPRKTEPLKGIIDKLHKEEKVPSYIITSMHGLNDLSTYGTHPKDFVTEQIKPVLINLDIIIKWYSKNKGLGTSVKTKLAEEVREGTINNVVRKKSITISTKKLAGLLSGSIAIFVTVFAVLFFAKVIEGKKQPDVLEKSIAVLPFENDSPSDSNQYFINGLMDEILINLQKIKSFTKVLSRPSTEKYKGPDRPAIPEIAKRLGVNYLVGGSGQKYGNSYRLSVQLIEAKNNKNLWAHSYVKEILTTKDIFDTYNEIAQAIAEELKAVITPEEKQIIEKTPTTNLTAYDFYQRGKEEEWKSDKQAIERAEKMYKTALKYDSRYAKAYTGLARVYWAKHYWEEYFSKNFLDSVPYLCDIAISIDPQLSEAYTIKGNYYGEKGDNKQALENFDKAIKFNPNDWMAYLGKGDIKSLQIAASLNHGPELPSITKSLAYLYTDAGFIEMANKNLEYLKLIGEPIQYLKCAAYVEHKQGHWGKAIEYSKREYDIDSTDNDALEMLGYCYSFIGQFEESLKYYKKYVERLKSSGQLALFFSHRIGYAYFKNGYKKEADYYFDRQIDYCNGQIKLNRPWAQELYNYYDLAGVYAFRGDKVKAYKNLKIYNQRQEPEGLWMVSLIKTDPLFDSIRNEPEFQQIVRDVETRYQALHERVRKQLEEQGML
jgi:TolB-like protein